MNYIIQRSISAGLIYLSIIYVAEKLGVEEFGVVAFLLFLAKFMHITNFGSASGYIYQTYNNSDEIRDSYTVIYFSHLVLVSVFLLLIVLTVCWNKTCADNLYHWPIIFFLIQSPLYAIEPRSRVKRRFYISLLPELFLVTSLAVSVYITSEYDTKDLSSVLVVTLAILVVQVGFFLVAHIRGSIAIKLGNPADIGRAIKDYVGLLKSGFPLYIGTMLFLIFLLIDRYYIKNYHSEELLGVYMMAFNFAFISSLIIGSLNFMNAINIGESLKSGILDMQGMKKNLKYMILSGAGLYIVIIIASYAAESTILEGYPNLTAQVAMLSFGFMCFYISGNFSPILFFRGKQYLLTRALIVMLVISFCSNIIFVILNLPGEYIAGVTSLLLLLYSVYSLLCSFNCSEFQGK